MEFVFPDIFVPQDFAGEDLAGPDTFSRLYDFTGNYKILFGTDFKFEGANYLVVAAAETFGFLRRLAGDEDIHALSIFEPIMFGRRNGREVSMLKFIGSTDYQRSVLEIVTIESVDQAADGLELYLSRSLLKYYPNTLQYILNRVVLPSRRRWDT